MVVGGCQIQKIAGKTGVHFCILDAGIEAPDVRKLFDDMKFHFFETGSNF